MKKQLLLLSMATIAASTFHAQVEDVSIVVSPTLGYNWFDKKSTIDNGLMYGFQAGFGFGRVIELRGIYERSLNMKQNFGEYEGDLNEYFPGLEFSDREVDVTRVGGEFKANIPAGGFSPYILLGTGVQTYKKERANRLFNDEKTQNLYASAGIGFKVNMGNRVTLNLEGRGLAYNMNPGSMLYNPGGTSGFDDWINNQDRLTMYNWSATAALQFYLGGRNEDELSEMDRAYLNRFSSGMSGVKVTLAPAGAYVNFNENSPYRNTYMYGGDLGIELTDFVGLKGYYYQATKNEDPAFDFDKMAMYGVDFVGKLNVPRGIIPYITVGGGYINVKDEYNGREVLPGLYRQAESGPFAKGGVGLEVPISQYFGVYGAANLLYTIDDNNTQISDLRNTDQLRQHAMYNVGVRLKLGKSAETASYQKTPASERSDYRDRMDALEKELLEAYNNNDTERMNEIIAEKKALESGATGNDMIRMTPAELESMIDKVIEGVENESTPNIENRLERLEQLLINMNQSTGAVQSSNQTTTASSNSAVNDRLINEINRLNQQLDEQRQNIDLLRRQNATTGTVTPVVVDPGTGQTVITNPNAPVSGVILNNGLGAYIGANFGDASTFNVGLRGYYGISNSPIYIMPEAYVAFGDDNGFGISANGVLPIRVNDFHNFEPYVGVGLGIHNLGNKFRFNTNILGGVAYRIGRGSVFADYTIRGVFVNNQLAFGYRFRF